MISFDLHIKPLFRDFDRDSMLNRLDLWCYEDVFNQADAILHQVEKGYMPCDKQWENSSIELFRGWIANGKEP